MNSNNVVKIGSALKWRGVFDLNKNYYLENLVTACGCVFRCKVQQAQGISPIDISTENGHISYINEDVWDVIVDMAHYYNLAVDSNNLTQETFEYIQRLEEGLDNQRKEIDLIKQDDSKQWETINKVVEVVTNIESDIDHINTDISDCKNDINNLAQDIKDIDYETRIAALEKQTAQFIIICEKQQSQIIYLQELIAKYHSDTSFGLWNNEWIWDNELLWPDVLVEVPIDSNIYVDRYDSDGQTLYFKQIDTITVDYNSEEECITFISDKTILKEYNEMTETVTTL